CNRERDRQSNCQQRLLSAATRVGFRRDVEVGERTIAVHVDDEPRYRSAAKLKRHRCPRRGAPATLGRRDARRTPVARIDEIVDGIYRISTTIDVGGYGFQFNQFLIDDERPALIHTGMHALYRDVRSAIEEVLDPAKLSYVALL